MFFRSNRINVTDSTSSTSVSSSASSSLKRLSSATSTRNKIRIGRRGRREQEGDQDKERREGTARDKSSKKSGAMGGNVSRGIRHSHRDGGASARAAAAKAGAGSSENKMPTRLEMLLDMPTVPRETQTKHAWNSKYHCSLLTVNLLM